MRNRRLRMRASAAVSGICDARGGSMMLAGRPLMSQLFAVALPQPPIHADLNGIFLLSVAAGYLIPYREPDSAGGSLYLLIMGPPPKGTRAPTLLPGTHGRPPPPPFRLSPPTPWTRGCV